ncbi:PKD domain-containing protein [Terrabacter carboxydivorans]|uniref:PKD domain-containing protein n=1 Tax=Terrabacter carboxydivorans TaxID=619730 RepID=A0ABN3MCF4_9MICO
MFDQPGGALTTRFTSRPGAKGGWTRRRRLFSAVAAIGLAAGLAPVASLAATGAVAPLVAPAVNPVVASSTQFDITGFLQSATLDTPSDPHSGGTLTVNGHSVVVPKETIVILPASALTWQELFTHAPAPYGPSQTGLALGDSPKPLTTYEVHVVGNRVIDNSGDRYIAGLVHVAQQDLNSGAGYVNFIDYGTGEMEVGGTPGIAGTGTRVRINDPAVAPSTTSGRYGRAMSPDDRFQVDQDNPTILAETGFPMCIPRSAPTTTNDDALCPQANRPVYTGTDTSGITPQPALPAQGAAYTLFRMDSPADVDANTCARGTCADPRKQAPFEIGDYITFAGNLIQDGGANGGQYISAHTIVASLGIYTQPGIDPAYVSVDVSLIGTGGLTVFGAGEAAVRTRFEGMTTDESRMIRLYGVDINPVTGATSDREWGTIMPDPGPPGGAVRGRWRFRPPCTATVATQKACTPPPAGQFIPPTREVRAVVDGLSEFLPGTINANPASQVPGTPGAKTAANGIYYGQYHAPIGEYIFPENVPGTPVPENNFNSIPFLAYGGYSSLTGVKAGVLSPWPSNVPAPAVVCATPTINGAPYSVASGASIPLSGSVTSGASSPVTLQWTAGTTPGGTDLNGALTGATTTTPTFKATGLAAGTYNLTFTVSNPCGVASTATTITVQAAPPPTIAPIQNQTVTAGNLVTLTASSSSLPAPTWAWSQTAGPDNPALTQTPAAATAAGTSQLKFTPTVAGTYSFTVKATNANGSSPDTTVTVTVTAAVPTNVTLTPVEYRTSKQRLVITATSTDTTVSSMRLLPYLTETGTMFDPATLGAANLTVSLVAPGSFTVTAVGAPPPACNLGGTYATPCAQTPLTVKSLNAAGTVIGTSPPSRLDKIRQ